MPGPDELLPDDTVHLLTGAYAADALDSEAERVAFEAHLARCPECREEVRSLRETAAALAAQVAQPPPAELRRRVLAQVAQTPQEPPVVVPLRRPRAAEQTVAAEAPERARPKPWLRIAAAAAVLVAAVGGGAGITGYQQGRQAEQRADRLLSIVADPRAVTRQAAVDGGRATVVSAPDGTVLLAAGLPALDAERTYQVWLIRGKQITSAGLGRAGTGGADAWNVLVDGAKSGDQVAISVEPRSGSDQPTTTPVAVIQV
jgi:anti-sigma factor RsiW